MSDVRAETLVTCLGLRPIGYPPWTCRPVCSPPPLQGDSPHTALHMRFQPALCGAVAHITSLPWRHCLPFTPTNPSLVRILLLSLKTQRKSSTLHRAVPKPPLPSASLVKSGTWQSRGAHSHRGTASRSGGHGTSPEESELCLHKAQKVLSSHSNHLLKIFICA